MNTVAPTTREYIATNVTTARTLLEQAHRHLKGWPAVAAPDDHVEHFARLAANAAEHLYDADQVDEPAEAVREALAAAEIIMNVVDELRAAHPGAVDVRTAAATRLENVDRTLAALQQTLGMA